MARKMCASCGMPLKNEEDYGTKKEDKKSEIYCKYCLKNGEFINPKADVNEMICRGHKAIDEMKTPKFAKNFMKKMCEKQIPKLPRWTSEDPTKPEVE